MSRQSSATTRRLQEVREALGLSKEEAAVGCAFASETIRNYEMGYRGAGGWFTRNLRRYCEWLAEEAVRRGKPHLALSPEEFAPDVFGAVASCQLPVASGTREEEE